MNDAVFEFASRYGTTYEIRFLKTKYYDNANLAITVECFSDGCYWEPYATLTVNLGALRSPDCAYLDTNNVPDLCQFVEDNGWVEIIGSGRSGYCEYPLARFSDEFLSDVCSDII